MIKVKICGLKRLQDIEFANEFMPDYVGFVFAKSKRQVNYDDAKILRENLDKRIKTVGVFVNHSTEDIIKLAKDEVIDIIQLHGDENEEYIANIKKILPNTTIFKAVSVKTIQDITKWRETSADFLLLDNGQGGTGQRFDWQILYDLENFVKPYFIAGGLDEKNVIEVKQFAPFGVDVSGGVETDGVKDKEKIKQFIRNVRV